MGLQESKPLEKRPSKTKSNLTQKSLSPEDFAEFTSQLSTLSCITSTSESTFQYIAFQKLPFTGHYSALPLCSKISNNYQSIFVCYDCSTDNFAFLCEKCFEKGNHDSHRFSVFPNNNGWTQNFCRCGDQQFMKKKTICEAHLQAPKITNQQVDKKELSKFSAFFNEVFKILFSLLDKNRAGPLLNSIFSYLKKITDDNLYFSKVVCQFFLQKNSVDNKVSNLRKFVKEGGMENFGWFTVFRNLSFVAEYKVQMIRQIINGFNDSNANGSVPFFQFIINFSGKVEVLNLLAKEQGLVVGANLKEKEKRNRNIQKFYELIIKSKLDASDIWKWLVKNNKLLLFLGHNQIMSQVIFCLMKDQQYILLILGQLLKQEQFHTTQEYILSCLMILNPEIFIPSSFKKTKSGKTALQKLEKQFLQFYTMVFLDLNTHCQSEQIPSELILLLPYFSFGQSIVTKFWEEIQKRVEVISRNKQRRFIKQASMNIFELLTTLLSDFMTWDHQVLRNAHKMNLISYTKDSKLVQKVLVQYFDRYPKLPRLQLLTNVDIYTQKQRSLAKDVIKKNLRYNPRKGKYYNITKKLPNNSYSFEDLNIGSPLKFTEWQQFIGKKFFTDAFYRLVPSLIKIAQKGLMEDIQMVKIVSNISVCICLLNKNQKRAVKEVTRNFIKEIPDVRESIYYVLAKIRDRLELDVDDLEQQGKKGSKKPKLEIITEIRDKKYREIKLKQEKMRQKWLKQAQKLQSDHDQEDADENICYICKQKPSESRRLVFPCNFTRNNVVSSLLRSQVTDLDINICLHRVHEDCFDKVRQKGECPTCKFQINCYVPQKPLSEESYTKNWMRNFENIVTTINMESGKSFNSDWATIFLTYLVYSKSFKVLLKNTQLQEKQRSKTDEILILHYKNQLDKWPQLTKQAIKKAEKTVKGQVRRQSNVKKAVKTLVLDLVIQQITSEAFKNVKRVEKKFRELINIIGSENAEKVNECFTWSKQNEAIQEVFSSNIAQTEQLFKIKKLPEKASEYLSKTSIKCPMCNKYQPTTWQCLFCDKISCQNCINPRFHCERDHRGSGIILHRNNAQYQLFHENRQVEKDSLYRNEYREGWQRNDNPEGWEACTDQIYKFFDTILHSQNPSQNKSNVNDNSDNEGEYPNRGWENPNQNNQMFGFQTNSLFGAPNAFMFGQTNLNQNVESNHEQQENQQQEEPQEKEEEQEEEEEEEQQQVQQVRAPRPKRRRR